MRLVMDTIRTISTEIDAIVVGSGVHVGAVAQVLEIRYSADATTATIAYSPIDTNVIEFSPDLSPDTNVQIVRNMFHSSATGRVWR